MNYLHPQLFFPISLFFFPLRPLVRGEGVFGPESCGENPTVNSAVRWSCRRHLSVPIFLSVCPSFHPSCPPSHPLLLSMRDSESWRHCDVLVYGPLVVIKSINTENLPTSK